MAIRKPGAPLLSAVPAGPSSSRLNAENVRPEAAGKSASLHDLDWSICMARAQNGDKEAYRRLLEDMVPYLRSLALRRFHNRGDAEDAVQETLLTVHAIRNTYDPARPFGPWLVAIANRRIVDGLRRQGRIQSREQPLEEEHETFSAPETNLLEQMTDGRVLRQALERLPAGQRQAITLLKLEQMSLKEASGVSGMSIIALKVATHRGMKSLRKIFRNNLP